MEPKSHRVICVVEDEPMIRLLLQEIAKEEGYTRFEEASSGQGVIALLQQTPITDRLLLLNWQMPNGNGADVLAWLRDHPDVRAHCVIIITSSSRPDLSKYDTDGFLPRPHAPEEYLAVLQRYADL